MKFQSYDSSSEAVDTSVFLWIYNIEAGQLRENSVVLSDPPRFVIGNEKLKASSKVVGSDEQRNNGLIELVEKVSGEAAGGEDEDRMIVEELTNR